MQLPDPFNDGNLFWRLDSGNVIMTELLTRTRRPSSTCHSRYYLLETMSPPPLRIDFLFLNRCIFFSSTEDKPIIVLFSSLWFFSTLLPGFGFFLRSFALVFFYAPSLWCHTLRALAPPLVVHVIDYWRPAKPLHLTATPANNNNPRPITTNSFPLDLDH